MSFQSLNPELTAKVLFLANLQRNLIQNQNQHIINDKTTEGNTMITTTNNEQQKLMHPLLMPSLNVSSQKISAMLSALTPTSIGNNSTTLSTNTTPIQQSIATLTSNNNNIINLGAANLSTNIRSNRSSFGWGNRERKMEENWRMQNRSL
ncbi:unnamed protein product [Adineta steineri]|uniref:Uncharacterized protein n=1 Tax=Adineta steineri TaxID=433720 RepID=A0A818M760_9BILA|nr:unnamed protein product [Adineta steineri]CAF3581536.1 unnamed protein product [Adineta steineri]CAF3786094.1 unnamed protein product [Adineta steineri]